MISIHLGKGHSRPPVDVWGKIRFLRIKDDILGIDSQKSSWITTLNRTPISKVADDVQKGAGAKRSEQQR